MRIAHVSPRFYPYVGGIETHVREISRRLLREGIEVEVLTTDPSGELVRTQIIDGVLIRRFRSFAPNEAYFLSCKLEHYLRVHSNSYDIVHAHSYSAFPSLHAARTKMANKFVFTPHYHETGHTFVRRLFHVPYRFLGRRIFEKADRIICVSEYEKRLILRGFNLDENKMVVIPNGINVSEIRRHKKRSKTNKIILYVGRLERYKGVQYLIEVLPMLDNNVALQIDGKGPYRDSLVALTARMGVKERVQFFQDLPREELLDKYVDADVFAMLSSHEAYGISVAEALCSRVPCIVANVSALKEWVDGRNCVGIDYPINLEKLRDLIVKLIGRNVDELDFQDWNEVTRKIMEVYVDVLG
jgi:glycosyltransferase involved in cell wall biosynthesis